MKSVFLMFGAIFWSAFAFADLTSVPSTPSQERMDRYDKQPISETKRDCRNDDFAACFYLGFYYAGDFQNYDINAKQAAKFFGKACDGGLMLSCHNLGGLYFTGRIAPIDYAKAALAYESACLGGIAESCNFAGASHWALDRATQAETAKGFFDKGCDLGDAESCYNLATTIASDAQSSGDFELAAGHMARACELGDIDACSFLQRLGQTPK
ncbi:hypothetical protein HY29_09370 [Hyphomonas beringensis]|uniref:Uncharacterized protein n=1 Tax=Hyphomonas beringensis TaxID=1280946 RepID=A0A062U7D4_9PROT|nr:tetratricopeptide repeat protein [Hyphomonas beringensis]KCZ56251.1 hypothetical protein HY29_09370 [Hyphomonas beringensis]